VGSLGPPAARRGPFPWPNLSIRPGAVRHPGPGVSQATPKQDHRQATRWGSARPTARDEGASRLSLPADRPVRPVIRHGASSKTSCATGGPPRLPLPRGNPRAPAAAARSGAVPTLGLASRPGLRPLPDNGSHVPYRGASNLRTGSPHPLGSAHRRSAAPSWRG